MDSRASNGRACHWRSAACTMPRVRSNLSVSSVAAPNASDNSPCITRRLNSSCQPRSWACTKPMANHASLGVCALMWVTSVASRVTCKGAFRPAVFSSPSSTGKHLATYTPAAAISASTSTATPNAIRLNQAVNARTPDIGNSKSKSNTLYLLPAIRLHPDRIISHHF